MLEALVLTYGGLPEIALFGIAYVTILIGGALAAVLLPSPILPLARSWYFFNSALATLILSCAQLLWLAYVPALKLGVSFLLMLMDVAVVLAFGAYIAQQSRARSLDGFGHGGMAWLGFVPLFNLILLFRASRLPEPARGSALAAWVGIGFSLLSRLPETILLQSQPNIEAQIANDPEAVAILQVLSIRAEGLDHALETLVLSEGAPRAINSELTLASVSRNGTALSYEFVFEDPEINSVLGEDRRASQAAFCSSLMPYLEAGATADIRFVSKAGLEIVTLRLSVTECTA